MDTIFTNCENSKTSESYRLFLNLTEKANLKRSDRYGICQITCPTCLVLHVLSCPTCPGASGNSCPTCSYALRASCATCCRALRASCPTCLVPYLLSCLPCPVPFFFKYPIASITLK